VSDRVLTKPGGDMKRHLQRDVLEQRLAALPPPPRETGRVTLLVSRREEGVRETPERVRLTSQGGMPGDAWARRTPDKIEVQLTVMQADVAELVANGQTPSLFGDNLLVELDLSAQNLPEGTRLRAGTTLLQVTPEPHNGCLKFCERFGQDALKFTADPRHRDKKLRGIHMRVVEAGEVGVGDEIRVVERPD
jgi:MOSC domain-containing protein YiiM